MVAYTDRLRLTKQDTGSNENTWGEVVNTLLDLLDRSVAGAVSIDLTAAGDYTLTASNGMEDEARYAALILEGTPSAAKNVIIPGVSKLYYVKNTTAHDISVGPAGGTAGVVGPEELGVIFCDGSDAVKYLPTLGTPNLLDGSVTTPKLADEAVTGAKTAEETLEDKHMVEHTLTERAVATGTLTERVYGDESISTRVLQDNSVTVPKTDNDVRALYYKGGVRQSILRFAKDESGEPSYLQDTNGLTLTLNLSEDFVGTIQNGLDEYGERNEFFRLTSGTVLQWTLPNATSDIRVWLKLDPSTREVTTFYQTKDYTFSLTPPTSPEVDDIWVPGDGESPKRWTGTVWEAELLLPLGRVSAVGGNIVVNELFIGNRGIYVTTTPYQDILRPILMSTRQYSSASGAGGWTTRITIRVPFSGTARLLGSYSSSNTGSGSARAERRVVLNGAQVGGTSTSADINQLLTLSYGDVIQIQTRATSGTSPGNVIFTLHSVRLEGLEISDKPITFVSVT